MTPKEELKQLFAERKPIDVQIEINGFTGFRATSIDELSEYEALKLLEIYAPKTKTPEEENEEMKQELLRNGWIAKILKLAEATGIKETGNFNKFNNWMYNSSKYKKHLNAHNTEELQILHRQLQAVKTNNFKSAKKPLTQEWWKKGKANINLN